MIDAARNTLHETTKDYNWERLSKDGDKNWDDIVTRFINEIVNRGAKTPREDLEWVFLNYYALPNSPALHTAGMSKFYASACSSYPVEDSLFDGEHAILKTLDHAVRATQAGIGTGFNFSRLRSKEEPVAGRTGVSGGPVSFLRSYNGFISEITQSMRKSASMGLLHVSHPDIVDYINCKKEDGKISNFNLSTILSDKFMQSVLDDKEYEQIFPYSKKTKMVSARSIFNLMAERIWDNGEPGVMFEDTIRRDYFNGDNLLEVLANPCSEALLTYGEDWLELCVLGSINLVKYTQLSKSDRNRVVSILVSTLNDIIDVQDYVLELQRKGMQKRNRKIGIGVTGLATVLAIKNIKYSSNDAFDFSKDVFAEIGSFAMKASSSLGDVLGLGRYNASLLSVAPTSTLSNIFNDINPEGCSYGIEPYFNLSPITIKNSYGTYEKQDKIVKFLGGKVSHVECANDLTYIQHIRPLEAYYTANPKGITQGCSKTVNFKENVTLEEIKDTLIYCWKHGIKAISFYRDGSRKDQVFTTKSNRPKDIVTTQAPIRPEILPCDIFHAQSGEERWIVLVGLLNDRPYEIFAGMENKINIPRSFKKGAIHKNGHYNLIVGKDEDEMVIKNIPEMFENDEFGALTRLISTSLRHGGPLRVVCEQLQKEGKLFNSFPKVVARVLKHYIKDNEQSSMRCEKCGGKTVYVQGCPTCSCGWSKCS